MFALVVTRIAHLLRVLCDPPLSPAARAVASVMVGSSFLGLGGMEPSSKRACHWSFLSVPTR
jgi:hypothetical protein